MGNISDAYRFGKLGLPKDEEKAQEWYQKFIQAQLPRK